MKTSVTSMPATAIKTTIETTTATIEASAVMAAMMITGIVAVVGMTGVVTMRLGRAGVLKQRSAQKGGIGISTKRGSTMSREIFAVKAAQINEPHNERERKDKNNYYEKGDPNHRSISFEEQYAAAMPLSPINFNSI